MDRFFFYRSPKRRRRWVLSPRSWELALTAVPIEGSWVTSSKRKGLEKAVSTWTPESQPPTVQCSRQHQCSHFNSISVANYGFCRFSFPVCVWTQQEQTPRNSTELFKDWCMLPSTDRREDRSRYTHWNSSAACSARADSHTSNWLNTACSDLYKAPAQPQVLWQRYVF